MNLVVVDLGTCRDHSERVRQIVESTLLTKHLASTKVTHHDVFLLCSIIDSRFTKNIGQRINWMNSLANTAVDEEQVVALFVDLDHLIAVRRLLLYKEAFSVFNDWLR